MLRELQLRKNNKGRFFSSKGKFLLEITAISTAIPNLALFCFHIHSLNFILLFSKCEYERKAVPPPNRAVFLKKQHFPKIMWLSSIGMSSFVIFTNIPPPSFSHLFFFENCIFNVYTVLLCSFVNN